MLTILNWVNQHQVFPITYTGYHLTMVIFYVVSGQWSSLMFPKEMLFLKKLESKHIQRLWHKHLRLLTVMAAWETRGIHEDGFNWISFYPSLSLRLSSMCLCELQGTLVSSELASFPEFRVFFTHCSYNQKGSVEPSGD